MSDKTAYENELNRVTKKRGRPLMVLGVLFLLAAAALVAYNRSEDSNALKESALALTQVEAATSQTKLRGLSNLMPVISVDGRDYIGQLQIESVGLDLPVLAAWDDEGAKIAPCRFSGSAYDNSMVLCGHNMRALFSPVKNLPVGEEVLFTDVNGNEFLYRVKETYTLQPEDVEEMVTGDDWDLTLFTCTYGGSARVTVRCELIEER